MLIGCIPSSPDFRHPADRRRPIFYFDRKNYDYEIANFHNHYEYVYISISADLGKWSSYKKQQAEKGNKVYVIFDLSDAFFMAGFLSDTMRSLYHFISGKTSSLSFSYKKTLFKMIDNTDVLLCGSDEQKTFLDQFHPNVLVLRDFFGHDIRQTKKSYQLLVDNTINIFWEGFSHGNIEIFKMLRDILQGLPGYKVNLHIVTDSEYCKIGASHLCTPTYSVLKKVFSNSDVRFHLYDWNAVMFSSIATSCDFAVIPIPNDPVMMLKPENKMLLLWSLGLPVITTNTPSYSRVMRNVNEDFICSNREEWREKIVELASSQERRERYMVSAGQYISRHCSAESISAAWDQVFTAGL